MKKVLWIGAALAVAAMALAATLVEGVRGAGTAKNAEGRIARFEGEVRKITKNGETRVGGRFTWEVRQSGPGRPDARIVLRNPVELVKQGNQVAFAGPARATIFRNGRATTVEGRLRVVAIDRREPNAAGNAKDRIAVEFVGPTAENSHTFEGDVERGDLRVFERSQD